MMILMNMLKDPVTLALWGLSVAALVVLIIMPVREFMGIYRAHKRKREAARNGNRQG
jgi:hypothetical protein